MFRLLGILLGSAIAVAFLILLVGVPQIGNEPATEPVAVQLPLRAEPIVPVGPVAQAETHTETPAVPAPEIPDETVAEADPVTPPEPDPAPPAVVAALPEDAELRWYAFWSPFRSQIAANGFVAQLQRVTGLDYRVVSVKPGVYEVAFAYSSDTEIQANLSQISTATGLDIPGN